MRRHSCLSRTRSICVACLTISPSRHSVSQPQRFEQQHEATALPGPRHPFRQRLAAGLGTSPPRHRRMQPRLELEIVQVPPRPPHPVMNTLGFCAAPRALQPRPLAHELEIDPALARVQLNTPDHPRCLQAKRRCEQLLDPNPSRRHRHRPLQTPAAQFRESTAWRHLPTSPLVPAMPRWTTAVGHAR